jgi:hypothetical protein
MKVIEDLRPSHKAQLCPHLTNGSGVMIPESWGGGGCYWKTTLDRLNYLDKSGLYAHLHKNSGETLNTKILENFIIFLTRG